MKRLLALLLVTLLACQVMSGCGNKNTTDIKGNTGSSSADKVVGGTAENNDEEPYEVVIECLTLGQDYSSIPAMEEAINAITIPAINCTVSLNPIHIADHATKTALWAAGGEKVDIYYVGTTVPFAQFVSDGMIIALDDLLAEYGSAITNKAAALMDGMKVNGQTYAIPQDIYCASAPGFNYNADMLKEIDMQMPEVLDLDTLTQIGYKLKAVNPDYTLIAKNGSTDASEMQYFYAFEAFGNSQYTYGVVLDLENSTDIVNIYKSDLFKDYCRRNAEWKENGLMPADQAVNGENATDVYKSGTSFGNWVSARPSEEINVQNNTSFDSRQVKFGNIMLTSAIVQEKCWGISTNCEKPEKAMQLMNLMYEETQLATLLNYGVLDLDYVYTEGSDKIITYPEGVNAGNVGWARNFCMFGDQMEIPQMAPATEDYYDDLKTFNDGAKKSATLGYTFDASEVAAEVAAVSNTVQEYVPSLVYGEVSEDELDAYISTLNEKLDQAGIENVIEANKEQLKAWMENK